MKTTTLAARLLLKPIRYLGSPAGIYLVTAVLRRASGLILLPLYVRRFTLEDYGDYGLALTIVTLGGTTFTLGLVSFTAKTYYDGGTLEEAEERTGSLMRDVALVVLGWGLLSVLGILMFAPAGDHGLRGPRLLLLLLVATVGAGLSPILLVYLRTVQRPYALAALQGVDLLTSSGFGLLFVFVLGRGLAGAIEALALSGGITGAFALLFIFGRLRGRVRLEPLRAALPFAATSLFQFFAAWLLGASDRWCLKFYGFDAGVGVFVIATQLASPAAMPMGALADAEIARVGEIFKERKLEGVRSDLPHAMKRYGLASVLPAVALVMAIPLFSLILGARTRGALSLVPWLALIALVDAPYYPLSTVLYYASRLRAVSFVTAVSCFATLGAMTVLVPQFGVAGALVARAIAAFIRLATIAAIAVGVLRDVRRERSLPF